MALEVEDTLLVDLVQEQDYIYLKCKQYDNWSRTYRIQFMNRGLPYTLNGTEVVIISMRQEGEEEPYVRKACSWGEDGLPYITFTSGMLCYFGLIEFDFMIIDGYSSITSRTSHIDVQKSLIYVDGLIQSEEFAILEDLIAQANEIPYLIEMFWDKYDEMVEMVEDLKAQCDELLAKCTELEERFEELDALVQALVDQLTQLEEELETAEAERVANEEQRIANEDERIAAEEERIANEELRQEEEAARKEAFEAIVEELEQVKEEVIEAGEYAEYQGTRVENFLNDVELTWYTLDCGYLDTDDDEITDVYDCGTF